MLRCKVADWGNFGFTAHTLIRLVTENEGGVPQGSSFGISFPMSLRNCRQATIIQTWGHESVGISARFVQFWANGSATLHASFSNI